MAQTMLVLGPVPLLCGCESQQWATACPPGLRTPVTIMPSVQDPTQWRREHLYMCAHRLLTQDAVSKLYLGALLRKQPAVAEGVITSVNGGAWFDVYVPRYGVEGRLLTADMPCCAAWDSGSKCVDTPASVLATWTGVTTAACGGRLPPAPTA